MAEFRSIILVPSTERIESNKPYETSFDASFLSPVNSNEVIDSINNLKDDTAAGFDKISVKLLKTYHFLNIAL